MNLIMESVMGHGAVHCRASQNVDVDQQASSLTYARWGQRYDQLSAGRFTGSLQEVELPALTLIRETSNRVILQKGCTPNGVFAIGAVLSPAEHGYHCGDIMRPRSAALLDPRTEFEIRTPEVFDLVAAVFSPRELCASLDDPRIDYRELEQDLLHSAKTIDPSRSGPLADFLLRAFQTGKEAPEHLLQPSNLRQLAEEFYGMITDTISVGQGGMPPPSAPTASASSAVCAAFSMRIRSRR